LKKIRDIYIKRDAFTLVELLAVIVILAIILAIAMPSISGVIKNSTKNAFESNAKLIIDTIKNKTLIDSNYDVSAINVGNLKNELGVNDQNYQSIKVKMDDNNIDIEAIGKNKWDDLGVYGTRNDLVVFNLDTGLTPTADSCFVFDALTGTINDYLYTSPSCPSNVVIPSQIGGAIVRSLGDDSFSGKSLVSATISPSVTSIGYNAFNDNLLTSVDMSDNVTYIDNYAFQYNSLTSIDLPDTVTYIGNYAFGGNNLISANIPAGITILNEGVFSDNQLTNITFHNNIASIGVYAFDTNQLTSITIPSSVTSIGSRAFSKNQLSSVTLNQGLKTIDKEAFTWNKLTSITIPSSVTSIGEGAFNSNLLPDAQAFIYARKTDGSVDNTVLASYGGSKTSGVVIPSNVTTIGNRAFEFNSLSSITIPATVTSIGSYAFSTNSLSSITIPNSVNSVGDWAFFSNSITTITMGKTGTTLGNYLLTPNNNFRTSYVTGGAGTYKGTQTGTSWIKQ
jgi:prepilin-type N-terminal cleavage/methylation domain-containing protein